MFLFAFAALGAQAAMVAKVGETAYETLDEAIKAVRDGETIVVNAGEYKLNGNLTYTGKAFTIQAAEDAKVSFDMSAAVALHGAKITFAGVTFDYKTKGDYIGLQHTDTLVYNDCTVNGKVFLYAASETFNRCTFVQEVEDYNVWTYGAKSVTFNGCTFKNVGKTINAYIEGNNALSEPQKIEMADCTVESSKSNKAVVNIKNKTQAYDITLTGKNEVSGIAVNETTKSAWYQVETTDSTDQSCKAVSVTEVKDDGTKDVVYVVKPYVAAFVTVTGIAGFADRKFASFAEAYTAIKPTIEKLGLKQESATADAFDALFTSVDANGNATLTYTISGTVVYDETVCTNLLTMGRKASHYGNGRHLINFKFVGATGKDTDTLTVNSNITLPYEWWGEKTTTGIHFENLTITGSAPSGLYPSQPFFEGIDFSVSKCALKGIKIYNCSNVEGSYTITDSVLDGTGAPADSYAIHLQGNETAPLSINIKGNTISGYDRGINIDQKTAVATIEGNTISVTDTGRSCIQLSSLATADIVGNTLELTGGNAITLHEKLLTLSAAPKVSISGNKVTGKGYLVYDDAKANDKEFTSDNLKLTYATDNTVAATVDTTQGVKDATKYELSGTVATTLHSVDFAAFVKALTDAGYTFDGSKHARAQNGKLTVKWSPVSGCYDKRGEGHDCTVGNVIATANTPKRVNSGLTQFQLFEGESHAVNVKNVAFVYEPAAFTVCENSGWKGSFTADDAPAGQIFLMNTGDVTFEGCSFDKVVLTSFNCTGTSTVKDCSFKNVYNSYAVKDIRGATISVTGCKFENCGAAVMVSSTVKVEEVTISGNTFTNVDVAGTTPADKVGTRGLVQIASLGNYAETAFDFSGNTATDCGPVLRQLNSTVSFDPDDKTNLGKLVSDGGASTFYTDDTFVAQVGDTKYATLAEAFAAFSAESHTLALLKDAAWNVKTPVYWAAGTQSGYAATLTAALTAAYKADAGAITIVCRPGADVGTMTHGHVADDLTIYGNDAFISDGECDLEVDQYKYSRATGAQATDGAYLEKDITITAYELDNLGVWGERHTAHTVTVNLTDCDGKALEGKTNVQRVYISGTTGVNDITLTDCDFLTKATAVYSNADGAIKAVNCSFTGGQVPFNINHKANGTQTVAVENCTFTNCGDADDWKQFAAPLRLVNSGAGTQSAEVTGCAFAGTVGANGDILLGDGRTGQTSNDVELKVVNTAANIQAQKPGYYGGETVDATKMNTAASPAEGTLETSVAKLLPVNDGSEAHPYSREQFAAMTRADYITAQERLGGTLYVNVGNYAYEKNGVLGNGVRDDTTGQVPDHSKLNAYGENGYLGEKNDGANGQTVVFVGGTITSGVTGYTSIDNIGTSLLLAVPAYTKVTFKGTAFKNVLSFDYQLYTSPWSQLGGLTFNGCTFDGIIVGAIASQELAFNGCTFNDYVNTTDANSSNPTWIRPAYGNWTKDDNEGQGTGFRSLTKITFENNKVTSTRPVKFERIAQWEMATTVTATNNTFAITPQEGDKDEKKTKNVGLYFGANAKFDLVVDKNEKSGETAALYTAVYSAPTEVTYVGLPAGSTVKNAAGEEVATGDGDALAWKTTKKITLKTTEEVASVTNAKGVSVNFATLSEAVKAAQAGETVKMLADVTLTAKQTIAKALVLDLNGKTISSTAYRTISLGSGANVTIRDSSTGQNGKITNGYTGNSYPRTIYLDASGTAALTVESGIVESNPNIATLQSVAIDTDNKKTGPYVITITGGKVLVPESSTNGRAIVASKNTTLNITGGEIVGGLHGVDVYGGSTTAITGGSISARVVDTGVIKAAYGLRAIGTASVAIGAAEGTADVVSVAGIKMDDDGYKLDVPAVTVNSGTIAGPVYSITKGTIVFNVQATSEDVLRFADDTAAKFLPSNLELRAKDIDGKTMYYVAAKPVAAIGAIGYETLEAALAAAKDGETVKLLADVTESVTIAADRTLTLDLNGKTLSAGKASEALTVTGHLTIDDTSAAKSGRVVGDGRYAVYMNNRTAHVGEAAVGGSLTLNAGSLEGATYGVYIRANQAAFTMNGGKVSATQGESIRVNNDYHAKTISLLSGEVGDVFLGSISSTELTTLTVGKADQIDPAAVKVGKIGL